MSEAHFAGTRRAHAATDEPGVGDAVMRRPKRAATQNADAGRQHAGDAVHLGCFERLLEGEARQDACESLGEHGLARARRPDHQHVVISGRGNFERAFGGCLAADIAEVRAADGVVLKGVGRRLRCGETEGLVQELHDLGQMTQTEDLKILDDGGLGGVLRRDEQVLDAALLRAYGNGEDATDGSQAAIEREFADQEIGFGIADGAHGAKDGCGHWQIEACTLFADVGRGQVDSYGTGGIAKARVDESGFDAFPALLDGRVGHANGDEVALGAAAPHIHFHVNEMSVNAIDSGTAGAEQGHVS